MGAPTAGWQAEWSSKSARSTCAHSAAGGANPRRGWSTEYVTAAGPAARRGLLLGLALRDRCRPRRLNCDSRRPGCFPTVRWWFAFRTGGGGDEERRSVCCRPCRDATHSPAFPLFPCAGAAHAEDRTGPDPRSASAANVSRAFETPPPPPPPTPPPLSRPAPGGTLVIRRRPHPLSSRSVADGRSRRPAAFRGPFSLDGRPALRHHRWPGVRPYCPRCCSGSWSGQIDWRRRPPAILVGRGGSPEC